jgi:hypothetical protein
MQPSGAGDRGDLARLALKVAEELDKALHGDATNKLVIAEFAACLKSPGGAPSSTQFLHNHRTIGALSRAWQRAYDSPVATVGDLKTRISKKVQETASLLEQPRGAQQAQKEEMKRFFLSLHRELLMQQFPPRPVRRARIDEDSMYG